jgi:hypothetical protein
MTIFDKTLSTTPFFPPAAAYALFQDLPRKYNIPYTIGLPIFNSASMDAFSPCSRPCGTPKSVANDVMAAFVPSFCALPYKPIHPAATTILYDSTNSVVIGKNNDEAVANNEKDRKPNNRIIYGTEIFDTMPNTPNAATKLANSRGRKFHTSLANN